MIAPAPTDSLHLPLVHAAPAWAERACAEWFDVGRYGANALPISVGGRGGAWYVDGPFGEGVLRAYRRGGLMARFSTEHYLWMGAGQSRCVREVNLLLRLRALGLPVPEPIAGALWREGMLYRAALLMQRVATRGDLMSLVHEDAARAPWAEVGHTLARFHAVGAHHPDLNARNVLQSREGGIVIIDWDRGRMGGVPSGWMTRELARLERSLLKYRRHVPESRITEGMAALRAAYNNALKALTK